MMVDQQNKEPSLNRIQRDDKAETGIGTLIVFIAMILVAAVAAGVLVRTSTNLQEQAEATGDQAQQRVATGIETIAVFGERADLSQQLIDNVTIHIQLSAGSPALDLTQLGIRWSDGSNKPRELNYTQSVGNESTFEAVAIRDADKSFSAANPVISGNDMVRITIRNVTLGQRTGVSIYMTPEGGLSTPILFMTPNTYTEKYVTLS